MPTMRIRALRRRARAVERPAVEGRREAEFGVVRERIAYFRP